MAVPYTPVRDNIWPLSGPICDLHGQSPSEAEIATHFMVSPPSAHQMVVMLERRGLIMRTPGQARSLRVLLPAAGPKDLDSGRKLSSERLSAEQQYPHIARWIAVGSAIELGVRGNNRSLARAVHRGRTVWEGKSAYDGLEKLLQDLDRGIAGRTVRPVRSE